MLLAVAAVAYILRALLLEALTMGLIVPDPTLPRDYILIVNGDHCFDKAVTLYQQRKVDGFLLITFAPGKLVRLGYVPSQFEIARMEFAKRQIPNEAVVVIDAQADSHWEAARHLRGWLRTNPGTTVVGTCSRFASREYSQVYSAVLGSEAADRMAWLPLKDQHYDESNWWHSKAGVLDVFNSYLSVLYVWLNGEQDSTWCTFDAEQWLKEQLTALRTEVADLHTTN